MSDKKGQLDQDKKYELFLRLLMQNQKSLFGFILSMIPHQPTAEDLLQETIMVMWRKFDEYRPNTNFRAWGFKIAKFNILQFHSRTKNSRVIFSTEALDNIAATREAPLSNDRSLDAIIHCIEKLTTKDKRLIEMRYFDQMKIKQIAASLQRPIHGMYKTMGRIHHLLQQCLARAIAST